MREKRPLLYLFFLIIFAGFLLLAVSLHVFWKDWRFISYPIHAAIAAFGAVAAILTAVFLLQAKPEPTKGKFSLLATGLLGMGTLEIFRSFSTVGHGFILLRSISNLVGGFWFASICLPGFDRYAAKKKWLPAAVFTGSMVLGIWITLFRETFPMMLRSYPHGEFTSTAIAINLISGMFFMAAAGYFLMDFRRLGKQDSYLLACIFLLFGLSGLTFPFSAIWGNNWWLWHIQQLLSYLLLLNFVFHEHQQTLFKLLTTTDKQGRAEKALLESEKLYRTIVEHSNDMIWKLDTKGHFIYFNRRCEEISGYKLDTWLGKDFSPLIVEDDLPKVMTAFDNVLSGKPQQYEVRVKHQNGGIFILSVNTVPVYSEGKVTGTVSFGRDITEHMRADAELKKYRENLEALVKERTAELSEVNKRLQLEIIEHKHDEELLQQANTYNRSLIEASIDPLVTIDSDGKITDVNSATEKVTGYLREELIGTVFSNYFTEPEKAKLGYLETFTKGAIFDYELKLQHKDGHTTPVLYNASVYRDPAGKVIGVFAAARDVTEIKKMEDIIKHQAYYDSVTGLPNRTLFIEHLSLALMQARRNSNILALLFLDIDHFKDINDSLGHAAGDHLLNEVAARLKSCMRESDTVARIGGDEFTVLLPSIAQTDHISRIAEKILSTFKNPYIINGLEFYITASIGVSVYPDNGENTEVLMKNADIAMYKVKESGRNNYKFYNDASKS